MAIATLERCYNNRKVFEGVVKIRKGEAVKMILGTSSLDATKAVFKHFCNRVSGCCVPFWFDNYFLCVHVCVSADGDYLNMLLTDIPEDPSG